MTGPVQFAIGRSVNQVQILNPQITGRFVGKEKKNESQGDDQQIEQHGSIGKFYAVDYALIKIQGAVNPANLGELPRRRRRRGEFQEGREQTVL